MPRISTDNYDTVASWNGSQDLLVVEQTDGTKVATPEQVKQYVLGNSIDDVYSVMGQMGAKNLIPYPYHETTHEDHGITWTLNSDGTVTANGTATANSHFILSERLSVTNLTNSLIEGETYILSGCPAGGSDAKYDIFINETYNGGTVGLANDYGNGATFTLIHKTENNYGVAIRIRSGQAVSNLTFKPMLRLEADTDNTYQPYAKTNKQLTEEIGDLSQTGLTGDSVAEQLDTAREQIANLIKYTDIIINASTSGHGTPTRSSAGAYYEPLATYAALGVTRDKILSINLIDWNGITKSFTPYLGTSTVSVMTDSDTSIYAASGASNVVMRVVYKD